MYDFTLLRDCLNVWNMDLTKEQESLFALYYDMLVDRNRVMNLTTVTEWDEVCVKHFLDSAAMLSMSKEAIPSFSGKHLMDIGSGAGFPGLVLKILCPTLRLTLLDSLAKRVRFLNDVIEALHLNQSRDVLQNVSRETFLESALCNNDCQAIHGRAEELALYQKNKNNHSLKDDKKEKKTPLPNKGMQENIISIGTGREAFDIVTARAVSELRVLAEYALPLIRVGGVFCAYKSAAVNLELKQAESAIAVLGGTVQAVKEYTLPQTDIGRSLVIIQKVKPTPEPYPRSSAHIKKKPL